MNNKVKLNNISYLVIFYKRTENPCVAGSIPARATLLIPAIAGSILYFYLFTHSQMKILVSPFFAWLRLDAKTRYFPSKLNMGKPSNPSK